MVNKLFFVVKNNCVYLVYTIRKMTKVKPNLSMRIDPEIKEAYKQETYLQGVDMTEIIENFMLKYAEAGKRARYGKK